MKETINLWYVHSEEEWTRAHVWNDKRREREKWANVRKGLLAAEWDGGGAPKAS